MKSLCFPRPTSHLNDTEINKKIEELLRCITNPSPEDALLMIDPKKDKQLKLFTEIFQKGSLPKLQDPDYRLLVKGAIKLLLKYANHGNPDKENVDKKLNNSYYTARDNFVKLLNIYPREKYNDISEIVIATINAQNFWGMRKLCVKIALSLIEHGTDGSIVFHQLCDQIEYSSDYIEIDVKLIVKVLCECLQKYRWPENRETVGFLQRLLNLYKQSLKNASKKTKAMAHTNLRACLELSVRYFIRNIPNKQRMVVIEQMSSWAIKEDVNDDLILNYGSTLEYAAYMHQGTSMADTLTNDILAMLMLMIGSHIRFVSLIGNRVFQYLIDRNKNQMMFINPKIFFQDMQLNIKACEYKSEDKALLKKHRELIHESFLRSFINHRSTRLNVETTYCTVCLLILAIPCGFTAAAMCCLMMNLQDYALNELETTDKTELYHLHAIIISVLTFVCWLHDADDFHKYMNKIVMERAQWAPHLSPPLQSNYNFALHHVMWDKPELFPLDWEVRYGLWKRFRLNISTKTQKMLNGIKK